MKKRPTVLGIDEEFIETVKQTIKSFGAQVIPFTSILKALGYTGLTGNSHTLLSAVIAVCGVEMGFKVEKIGKSLVLVLKKRNGGGRNGSREENCDRI
jgi:hypothetical protein